MPIIARFILAANAAVFQTLLEEKGIPSTFLDSSSSALDRNHTVTTAISVPDEHVADALAVYAEYSKDNKARADMTERMHPNKNFPFLAIFALITLAVIAFESALVLPSIRADTDTETYLYLGGVMFVSGIGIGGGATWGLAFWHMILRMVLSVFKKRKPGG